MKTRYVLLPAEVGGKRKIKRERVESNDRQGEGGMIEKSVKEISHRIL